MPGDNLAGGQSDLSIALAALEAKVNALEKTGQWWPGMIAWTADSVAPSGFLIADGSAFDTDRYAALAVICPTGFLPDLRDKFAIGAGATYTVLATGGAATVTLTAAQSGVPAHAHPAGTTGAGSAHSHTQGSTGAGSPHSHAPGAGTNYVTLVAGGASLPAGTTVGTPATTAAESAHTHTNPATATEAAHTHSFTTPNSVAANAAASHSVLNPYVALTPLIHV